MWQFNLPTFRIIKLQDKGAEIETPYASRGENGEEVSPFRPIRGLGERCELPKQDLMGQSLGRKRIWGILSVAERLLLKENHVIRETFITAFSPWIVTKHQLAKMAHVRHVKSGIW